MLRYNPKFNRLTYFNSVTHSAAVMLMDKLETGVMTADKAGMALLKVESHT
jgi:predicted HAD superfamily phosphohydrolase YqeG